ncbi:MAG: SUMF1/EgtB/PvdO family nonheme iron enzyme [Spirochaetaceae bacterium]|nr:SUMF1/EgtB/PvdO family nonheme iron enzyme [Spirochaetaceae bacterium]
MAKLLEPLAPKTVTYHINGGTGPAPAAQKVKAGESVTLPGGSGLTKSGCAFGGWNTRADGTGTNYNAGSSYTPTETVTLYARWAAHVHEWGAWVVTIPPTETEDGEETRTCALDAAHTETRYIVALNHIHEWGDWTVTTPATCTTAGEEKRFCLLNVAHTETRAGAAALGHVWSGWMVTTQATCTTPGQETGICIYDAAHTTISYTTINPIAHGWSEWTQTQAPTETEDGWETRTCAYNAAHTETRAVAASTHTHEWGNWTVTTPATCTAAGEEKRTCPEKADHYETQTINALGHDYGNWTATTPATCTTPGIETGTCAHDAAHTEPRAIPAPGHNWGAWTQTTLQGIETKTCANDAEHTETHLNIAMVPVPGGNFEMGKELGTAGSGDETPVHTVTLTQGFYMGRYQVTQAQYQAVMGSNPSYFNSNPASGEVQGNRPVETVSWYDAIVFCNKLSIAEGFTPAYRISGSTNPADWGAVPTTTSNSTWNLAEIVSSSTGYRLPTEAQWEYAAKGGNGTPGNYTYSGSNDINEVAWYSGNNGSSGTSAYGSKAVGTKAPNGLGIYDMSGNVYEWCWDWYGGYTSVAQTDPVGAASGSGRVIRGGGWGSSASFARSVCRDHHDPNSRDGGFGVRLVRPSTSDPGSTPVTFANLTADGSSTATTTKLTLTFDKDITGLSAADITLTSGSTGAVKGSLTRTGTGVYDLAVSGITAGGSVSVAVSKSGYTITGGAKAVTVYAFIAMVFVPGGSFQMGNPDTSDGWDDERPVHTVTLTQGFYMGRYQVTQAQYQAVMGSNPSNFSSNPASGEVQGNRPVECVSWYDAIEFCNALSIQEGLSPYYSIDKVNKDPNNTNDHDDLKWTVTLNSTATGYRLPTEAQWEYAAKGGNGSPGNYTYSGSDDLNDVGWYSGYSNSMTHEVGKKTANGLGLYDMSGNVFEWCWDWYGSYASNAQTDPAGPASGSSRMLRGGGWGYVDSYARSVYRYGNYPYGRNNNFGFRLVRP